MIVKATSDMFPGRTVVLLCQQTDTVARVRASLLHVLHGMDRHHAPFRLRHAGVSLKNSLTLQDYGIRDEGAPIRLEMDFVHSDRSPRRRDSKGPGDFDKSTQDALTREVEWFDRREDLLQRWNFALWTSLVSCLVLFGSTHWFAGLWTTFHLLLALWLAPTFSRFGGFVRRSTEWDVRYFSFNCAVAAVQIVVCCVVLYLLIAKTLRGCTTGDCSAWHWYSLVVWAIWGSVLIAMSVLALRLRHSFSHQPGDLLEGALNRMLDIATCVKLARTGTEHEKRSTALELGRLAAASDANKLAILDHGGVTGLVSLALQPDSHTVAFAVEAISEMLTLTLCHEAFVHAGCIRSLFATCHDAGPSIAGVAITALRHLARVEPYAIIMAESGGLKELTMLALRQDLDDLAELRLSELLSMLSSFDEVCNMMVAYAGMPNALARLAESENLQASMESLQTLKVLGHADAKVLRSHSVVKLLTSTERRSARGEMDLIVAQLVNRCSETKLGVSNLVKTERLPLALRQLLASNHRQTHNVVAAVCLKLTMVLEDAEVARWGLAEVVSTLRSRGLLDAAARRNMDRCLGILQGVSST